MLTKEQITKEKKFQSAEELLAYAKETGHGLTEEKAKALFAQLHPNNSEVSDDELAPAAVTRKPLGSARIIVIWRAKVTIPLIALPVRSIFFANIDIANIKSGAAVITAMRFSIQ